MVDFYDKKTTWFRVCADERAYLYSVEKSELWETERMFFHRIRSVFGQQVELRDKKKVSFRLCCNYLQSNHVNFIFDCCCYSWQRCFSLATQLARTNSFGIFGAFALPFRPPNAYLCTACVFLLAYFNCNFKFVDTPNNNNNNWVDFIRHRPNKLRLNVNEEKLPYYNFLLAVFGVFGALYYST